MAAIRKAMQLYPHPIIDRKSEVGNDDLLAFFQNMSTLLSFGTNFERSLELLQDSFEAPYFNKVLKNLMNDIRSGLSISIAFEKHPQVFPAFMLDLICLGESEGILDHACKLIAQKLAKIENVKAKFRCGLFCYPKSFVRLWGSFIFLSLLCLNFTDSFYYEPGSQISVSAGSIIFNSLFSTWKCSGLTLFSFAFALSWKIDIKKNIMSVIIFLMSITPKIGSLFEKFWMVQSFRIMGTLIGLGIPVVKAVSVASRSSYNRDVRRGLEDVYARVRIGGSISDAIRTAKVFPFGVEKMIETGEDLGEPDFMLQNIANFLEREMDKKIDVLASILVPLGTILQLLIVFGFLWACFFPFFEMIQISGCC